MSGNRGGILPKLEADRKYMQIEKSSVQRTVIQWISGILEEKEWTGTDLAQKAHIEPSTILRLLNKPGYPFLPRLKTLKDIAAAAERELPESIAVAYSQGKKSKRTQTSNKPMADTKSSQAGGRIGRSTFALPLNRDGQVSIPEQIRAELKLHESSRLIGRIKDGALIIESAETALRRAQALVRRYVPNGKALVDELIAERRAAAENE